MNCMENGGFSAHGINRLYGARTLLQERLPPRSVRTCPDHWDPAGDLGGQRSEGGPFELPSRRARLLFRAIEIAAWVSCVASTVAALGESVTLQPVADTTLFETDPLNNLGATPNLIAGTTAGTFGSAWRNRALLKFDIAGQLPPGAVVTSAALTLTVVKAPAVPVDSTFDLRRVLVSWGEGDKSSNNGLPATTGEANWLSRLSPLPQWAVPGGAAGTDFETNISASVLVQGLGPYTFASSSNLVADVQSWADPTNSNFGWMLISQDEATASTARRFGSREGGTNAPLLAIEYLPPPVMAGMTRLESNMTCHFKVEAGFNYTVEYTDALPTTNWLVLTNLGAKVAGFEATITNALDAAPDRFFRLSRVPCNCR